jgi:hypothetical protein
VDSGHGVVGIFLLLLLQRDSILLRENPILSTFSPSLPDLGLNLACCDGRFFVETFFRSESTVKHSECLKLKGPVHEGWGFTAVVVKSCVFWIYCHIVW